MCGPVNYLRSARTTSTIITMTTTVPMPIYMGCPFISVARPPNCPPPAHPNPVSAQRVGDGVSEGRGRAPDQAAQVPCAGEHLATAQAEVGVGENVRQLGRKAGVGQHLGELVRWQIGVSDLLPGGDG